MASKWYLELKIDKLNNALGRRAELLLKTLLEWRQTQSTKPSTTIRTALENPGYKSNCKKSWTSTQTCDSK